MVMDYKPSFQFSFSLKTAAWVSCRISRGNRVQIGRGPEMGNAHIIVNTKARRQHDRLSINGESDNDNGN